MKAVVMEAFAQPMKVQTVPDPSPRDGGVVIEVKATGLCRSDWHAWMGHDTDIVLPHVPGHELAGTIVALGSPATCFNSIACLRKRGRHVQVGLMLGDHHHPAVPMDQVIAKELEILGSHGMQAHRYPAMLGMIQADTLDPRKLIGKTISLDQAPMELADMDSFRGTGVTVIDRFN
jgi:D-arabinose 1-dehydrogenase-like Zn-dependent alcohol dehydrogenase